MQKMYIYSSAKLGSGMANVLQSINMAEHLGQILSTTLFMRLENGKVAKAELDKIIEKKPSFEYSIQTTNTFLHAWNSFSIISKFSKNSVTFYSRSLILGMLAVFLGCRVLVELHQDKLSSRKIMNFFLMMALKLPYFKQKILFIVISNRLKEIMSLNYLKGYKVVVAHDVASELPVQYKGLSKRDRKLAVYTGKISEDRSVGNIVELAKKFPDVDFRVLGGKKHEILPFRNKIKESKLSNIKFLGQQRSARVKFYQNKADVLLAFWSRSVPTMDYCSPLKLFEYMQTGNKMLVHDFPVLREVLIKNSLVELCIPESLESEQEAFNRLLNKEILPSERDALLTHAADYTYSKRALFLVEELRKNAS